MNRLCLARMVGRMLLIAIALAGPIASFIVIDSGSHSASDTLRPWLIEVAALELAAGLLWLALDRLVRDTPKAG